MLKRRKLNSKLQALQQAIHDNPHRQSDLIAFTGIEGIYTPGELVYNHTISGDELRYWLVLRSLFVGSDVNQLPDQGLIAEKMGKSRQTINGYHKMLRATRWLSIIDTLKVNNLPTRYIYALHEQQLDIEEAWYLDRDYIAFIMHEAQYGTMERLLRFCRQTIAELDNSVLSRLDSEQLEIHQRIVTDLTGSLTILLPSVVKNPDSGEAPVVKNPDSGEAPVVKNPDSGEASVVKNPDSGEASVVKNPDSGEASVVKNPDSGEAPAVKNPDSGEAPAVKNPDSGEDIYNHARDAHAVDIHAHAPTQIGNIISCGNNINPTTNHRDGGVGGRDKNPFPWFAELPLSVLVEKVQSRYGKKTAHSVINRLKLGSYTWREETFSYRHDAEDAAIVLISLLDDEVKVPVAFVDALLFKAHHGELCWRGDQFRRYCEMTGQNTADRQHQSQSKQKPLLDLPDGTVLIGVSGQRYTVQKQTVTPPNEVIFDTDLLEKYLRLRREDGVRTAASILGLSDIYHALESGKMRIAEGGGE